MGKINLILKKEIKSMKAAFIFALVVVGAMCQQPENSFQTCLVDVRSGGDKILKAVTDAVQKNPMGILEILGALQEFQQVVTNCKKVQTQDVLMWIDQHSNAQQKDCLQKTIAFLMDIKTLEGAKQSKDATKIQTATVKLIQDLDTMWNGCLAFF